MDHDFLHVFSPCPQIIAAALPSASLSAVNTLCTGIATSDPSPLVTNTTSGGNAAGSYNNTSIANGGKKRRLSGSHSHKAAFTAGSTPDEVTEFRKWARDWQHRFHSGWGRRELSDASCYSNSSYLAMLTLQVTHILFT